jgi:hypothetical protein
MVHGVRSFKGDMVGVAQWWPDNPESSDDALIDRARTRDWSGSPVHCIAKPGGGLCACYC